MKGLFRCHLIMMQKLEHPMCRCKIDHAKLNTNIRAFSDKQKREAYESQKGICGVCGEHFELNKMEADHITP